MIAKIVALSISVLCFHIYWYAFRKKYGYYTESISKSFFVWMPRWKGLWFTLLTWSISIPIIFFMKMPWTPWNMLFWGAAVFMAACGVAADYNLNKTAERIHIFGSVGAIIMSLLGYLAVYGMWWPLALFLSCQLTLLIILAASMKWKRKLEALTWWTEVAAYEVNVLAMAWLIIVG